jgi:hypothetical protein
VGKKLFLFDKIFLAWQQQQRKAALSPFSHQTRLLAREYSIEFSHREKL